jgi:hypothetical protein
LDPHGKLPDRLVDQRDDGFLPLTVGSLDFFITGDVDRFHHLIVLAFSVFDNAMEPFHNLWIMSPLLHQVLTNGLKGHCAIALPCLPEQLQIKILFAKFVKFSPIRR